MLTLLYSASILHNDLSYLERINKKLLDPAEEEAITWALEHRKKFGNAPTRRVVENHPQHKFLFTTLVSKTEPLLALLTEAVNWLSQRYSQRVWFECEETEQLTGTFPMHKIVALGKFLSSLTVTDRVDYAGIDRDRLYAPPTPGDHVDFGFEYIDSTMGGIMTGEMVVFAARMGVGKSLVVCHQAVRQARLGRRVLIASAEMLPEQLSHRMDALLGGFNPRLFRTGGAGAHRATVDAELQLIKDAGGQIIFADRNSMNVAALSSEVHNLRPDLLIVDGMYLLKADVGKNAAGWEAVKSVSNALKQLTLDESIKTFGTTQLKRTDKDDGFGLEDIAYSDAIAQDADGVLMGSKEPGGKIVNVDIAKCRYGQSFGGSRLELDWDIMRVREVPSLSSSIKLGGTSHGVI